MMFQTTMIITRRDAGLSGFLAITFALILFLTGFAAYGHALTINETYPELLSGILGSARLEPLKKGRVLIAGGVAITEADLKKVLKGQDPKMRGQLEKNLLFLLEQEATQRLLLAEAQREGIARSDGDKDQAVMNLLERRSGHVSVSEEELSEFYTANPVLVNQAPFEQIKEGIREYLLNERKQMAIADYIKNLGDSSGLRVDEKWARAQSRLALDNPVDRARRSGRPTMAEFGAAGCVPCDMMQPILESLRKTYPDTLNVVFVHVGEEQILGARYGIHSIPVQVFFDAKGKETFRHTGFFPEAEVTAQLARMGVGR